MQPRWKGKRSQKASTREHLRGGFAFVEKRGSLNFPGKMANCCNENFAPDNDKSWRNVPPCYVLVVQKYAKNGDNEYFICECVEKTAVGGCLFCKASIDSVDIIGAAGNKEGYESPNRVLID